MAEPGPEQGAGATVLVVTAMPLSKLARAELSEMLGPGYAVVDMRSAPRTANIVLTPVVSASALGILRGTFPQARILYTELQDDERGISFAGPLSRIVAQAPDGYFVAHSLQALSPIVQSEAKLQLSGSSRRTPLTLPLTPGTPLPQQAPDEQGTPTAPAPAARPAPDEGAPVATVPVARHVPDERRAPAAPAPAARPTMDEHGAPIATVSAAWHAPDEQGASATPAAGARHETGEQAASVAMAPAAGHALDEQGAPGSTVAGARQATDESHTTKVRWIDRAAASSVPPGRWLDLDPVDSLVVGLVGTDEPRRDALWPALVAECVVRLAGFRHGDVLVDVGGLDPAIRAELQIRVESEQVDQAPWP